MRQSIYRLAHKIASMDWPEALQGSPLAFSLSQVGDLCYLPPFFSDQKTFALTLPYSMVNGTECKENYLKYGFLPLFPMNHPANRFHFLCCTFLDEDKMDKETREATHEVREYYREKRYGKKSIPVFYHIDSWQKTRSFRFQLLPWEEELMEQIMTSFVILNERLKTETIPELEESPENYMPCVYDQGEGHLRVVNLWDTLFDHYMGVMISCYRSAHVPIVKGILDARQRKRALELGTHGDVAECFSYWDKDDDGRPDWAEKARGKEVKRRTAPLPSCLPLSFQQRNQYILRSFSHLLDCLEDNQIFEYLMYFHLSSEELFGSDEEADELTSQILHDTKLWAWEMEDFQELSGKNNRFSPDDQGDEDEYEYENGNEDEDEYENGNEDEDESEGSSSSPLSSTEDTPPVSAKIIDIHSRKPWVNRK